MPLSQNTAQASGLHDRSRLSNRKGYHHPYHRRGLLPKPPHGIYLGYALFPVSPPYLPTLPNRLLWLENLPDQQRETSDDLLPAINKQSELNLLYSFERIR